MYFFKNITPNRNTKVSHLQKHVDKLKAKGITVYSP